MATKSSTGLVMNSLGSTQDATYIAPKHLPYYTTASGTSMATPHISGIVTLMLEAQLGLHPKFVLETIQKNADLMAGYAYHEVGAGYGNAFEAVKLAECTKPNIRKYRDKKTGKTYDTYFIEGTWNGSISS